MFPLIGGDVGAARQGRYVTRNCGIAGLARWLGDTADNMAVFAATTAHILSIPPEAS
jgi:hypothetical protein